MERVEQKSFVWPYPSHIQHRYHCCQLASGSGASRNGGGGWLTVGVYTFACPCRWSCLLDWALPVPDLKLFCNAARCVGMYPFETLFQLSAL